MRAVQYMRPAGSVSVTFRDPSVAGTYLIRSFSPAEVVGAGAYPASEMREVTETSEDMVRRAQTALNQLADDRGDDSAVVRNDGELDVDTLRAAADALDRLSSGDAPAGADVTALFTGSSSLVEALRAASQTRRLEGADGARVMQSLIAIGHPGVLSSSKPNVASWLMRGGIRFGTAEQAAAGQYPVVQPASDLQRSLPRTMNFVREYKYPLAIGGVAIVGAVAYYFYSREQM